MSKYPSKKKEEPHKKGRIGDVVLSTERCHVFMTPAAGKVVLVSIFVIQGSYGS